MYAALRISALRSYPLTWSRRSPHGLGNGPRLDVHRPTRGCHALLPTWRRFACCPLRSSAKYFGGPTYKPARWAYGRCRSRREGRGGPSRVLVGLGPRLGAGAVGASNRQDLLSSGRKYRAPKNARAPGRKPFLAATHAVRAWQRYDGTCSEGLIFGEEGHV